MSTIDREFLVAFTETVLGLPVGDSSAREAVERLEVFLARVPTSVRDEFQIATTFVRSDLPHGFSALGFSARQTALEETLSAGARSPPVWIPVLEFMLDRAAILQTVKGLLSAAWCEAPSIAGRFSFRDFPSTAPLRNGIPVEPPSGPSLDHPPRTSAGAKLKAGARSLDELPRRFDDAKRTVAVIGAGAAGIAFAHGLAQRPGAGSFRILVFEAGPLVVNDEFPTKLLDAAAQLYFLAGRTPSRSPRMGFLQGRCVGGSTTVNNASCIQPAGGLAQRMKHSWESNGAALDWAALQRAYEELASPLTVAPTEEYLLTDAHRRPYRDGFLRMNATTHGFESLGPIPSNLKDCVGCGHCNTGCRYDAKRSPLIALLPDALDRGVQLFADAPIKAIECSGTIGHKIAVDLRFESGRRLQVDEIVLAAGAYASPALLFRSGHTGSIRGRRVVGKRFSCNFASPVLGRFSSQEPPLLGGLGQQLAYLVEVPRNGVILETAFAPPAAIAMMLAQAGPRLSELLLDYDRLAVAFPTVSSDAYGEITFPLVRPAQIDFSPGSSDWQRLGHGLRLCAEAMRLAGAEEIFDTRVNGRTAILRGLSSDQAIATLDAYFENLGPADYLKLSSGHPQGGAVIHKDPALGVVGTDFRVHGIENLRVVDASVFPAPITLNLQYTVMAIARYAAQLFPL